MSRNHPTKMSESWTCSHFVKYKTKISKGRYVRAPADEDADSEDPKFDNNEEDRNQCDTFETQNTSDPVTAQKATTDRDGDIDGRLKRLEQSFIDLTEAILQQHRKTQESVKENDKLGTATTANVYREPMVNIRWDHIEPFPSNVAAREMWETWYEYSETFEIAATFSNANDAGRRTQLLYLAMGESLQEIVRAAGLKPDLEDPLCYTKFVQNIDEHLISMTDSSSEQEDFLSIKQKEGESVVCFHARIMEKLRLCG
ncbi:uncharacterized protein LOC129728228 [Wyeomyia smithii]|uniref:uncharacterized protein LOC129728228 n=1 Tax=Wyeomyia smithii TaxID=174621 RepID=UPI002468068E|nr:uncharacterized protein LOC129728228 [Wyeomyia smithii]